MHDTRGDTIVDLRWPSSRGQTLADAVCAQYNVNLTGESDADGNPCAALLIFDGDNRGVYVDNAVVDLAREYGWSDAPERVDTACGDLYGDFDVTAAETYLDDLTPDGWSMGFNDGSYYLANDAWWRMVGE